MSPPTRRERPGQGAPETTQATAVTPDGNRSTVDTCMFCGAPALEPNRADRRRGLRWVMVHAGWCPTQGMGMVRHSTKWARS